MIGPARSRVLERPDQGRPGSHDLDADRVRDHVLRAQEVRVRADPEDDRRAARPDPPGGRGGRQRPRRGAELLEQNRAILAEARSESAEILAEARKVADAQIQRAKEEAEAERQRRLEDTRKQIEAETARAIDQIRAEVADLTLEATQRVVGKVLDADDQRRLIEEAIEGLDFSALEGAKSCMAVAHRMYARALFEAAREQGRVERRPRAARPSSRDALEATPELEAFLANPQLDPGAKADVLDEVTAGADPLVRNFVRLVAAKGRAGSCAGSPTSSRPSSTASRDGSRSS